MENLAKENVSDGTSFDEPASDHRIKIQTGDLITEVRISDDKLSLENLIEAIRKKLGTPNRTPMRLRFEYPDGDLREILDDDDVKVAASLCKVSRSKILVDGKAAQVTVDMRGRSHVVNTGNKPISQSDGTVIRRRR